MTGAHLYEVAQVAINATVCDIMLLYMKFCYITLLHV